MSEYRKLTLRELYNMARKSCKDIRADAILYGRSPKVYLHWTAGHYNTVFPDYHICIVKDGSLYMHNDIRSLAKVLAHTWMRNSGAVGVAICGCYDADTNDLGTEPPTEEQINSMARVIAVLCEGLGIDIDKRHVLTHGEAANNEDGLTTHQPYACWNDSYGDGDTKFDLEYLGTNESPEYNPGATDGSRGGDVLRGKALWYMDKGLEFIFNQDV